MIGPADHVKAAARELFEQGPIERHPLFVALGEGKVPVSGARRIALQIFHVVDHFPRLIAAMLASLADWRLRMPLADNLFEEHGRMDPARVHVETYRAFLGALDVGPDAIAKNRPAIPTLAYNRAVLDLCLHHPPAEGLGALGVIEEIVARVSPLVARTTASLRRSEAAIVHFSDHEVLDVSHANEIYELASAFGEGDGLAAVRRGMELGFYYHRRLYSDLLDLARAQDGG